ncbi:hypothetical protein QBC41DRAFT_334935 [Cercophora samala]|uniref:Uncharacterized protein n=1 Tax=Cercophora samala TaxID=330535 RepID=A0AA40DCV5_9PEZI|nr:hypothetical protein QBC41DRAFT_334935 [Cercophora samala]
MRVSTTLLLSLGGLASTTTALHAPGFLWWIIDKLDRRCQYDCSCAQDDLTAQCCASIDGTLDETITPTCAKMNLAGATKFVTCCGSSNGYTCSQQMRCPMPDGGESFGGGSSEIITRQCVIVGTATPMDEIAAVMNGVPRELV